MIQPSFGHSDDAVSKAARRVYRVRPAKDSNLFTDSVFKFTVKTMWARVTTPRAVDFYLAVARQFVGLALLILATMAAMVVWVMSQLASLGLISFGTGKQALRKVGKGADRVGRGLGEAGRGLGTGVKQSVGSIGDGVGSVGRVVSRAGRTVVSGASNGVTSGLNRSVATAGRSTGMVGRSVGRAGRWFSVGVRLSARQVDSGIRWLWSLQRRISTRAWRVMHWLATRSARGLRRHRYATASLSLSLIILLTSPLTSAMLDGLLQGTRERIASLPEPSLPSIQVPSVSLPEVSIPKVTFHKPRLPKLSAPELRVPNVEVPDISIQFPAFVTVPIKRLDEILTGPLAEPGDRVLVADFTGDGDSASDLGRVLSLVLEAELVPARRFTVVPRERALAALPSPTRGDAFALGVERAIALAPATASAAVVTGRYEIADGAYSLDLLILSTSGEETYSIRSLGPEAGLLEAVIENARQLSRRLGEPEEETAESSPTVPGLSTSLPALLAYSDARAQLWRGRYRESITSAAAATRHDSAFAAAHLLAAQSYALVGERWRAKQALESAWQDRGRLPERERLRLAADREVFAGRYSDAIAGYDRLFGRYRDDVMALKSQAIVQRMIGARGRGSGNLRVAYSIDPVDWPPLRQVARFLGYRGRLPSVEKLAEAPQATSGARPSI